MAEDCDQARATLEEIGKTTQELEQIVESLLSLSRYESGIQRPEPEPVELSAEVRHEASRLDGAARARGLKLEFTMPPETWVLTDAALVRRLVANLIGNAVCHAPQDSAIVLRLDADGSFTIENPAPHLTPDDLPRLGERFFRIHSGNGGAHAGLGLSLVRAISQILDLRFDLELTGDHRLIARISGFRPLPA